MKQRILLLASLLATLASPAQAKPLPALLKGNYKYLEFARRFLCSDEYTHDATVAEWFNGRGLKATKFENLDYLDGADDRNVIVQSYSFLVQDGSPKKIEVRARRQGPYLIHPSALKISYGVPDGSQHAPLVLIEFAHTDCLSEVLKPHSLHLFRYKPSGWFTRVDTYRGNGRFVKKTLTKPEPMLPPSLPSRFEGLRGSQNTLPPRVAVAVLDTGFNYNLHGVAQALSTTSAGALRGWDYFDGDAQPFETKAIDVQGMSLAGLAGGHGTPVVNIIAKDNATIEILPYRVIPDESAFFIGEEKPTFDSLQIVTDAIDRAAAEGARIVNLSLTFPNTMDSDAAYTRYFRQSKLHAAMKRHKTLLFVVAAGNSYQDISKTPVYPASFHDLSHMLVVAGVDAQGQLVQTSEASGSNWSAQLVHIAALGQDVETIGAHGKPIKVVGTSFAAPAVAGLAAKMLQINSRLEPATIIRIMETSAKKNAHLRGKIRSGGVINEEDALGLTALTVFKPSRH